jgi:hypothetical protein
VARREGLLILVIATAGMALIPTLIEQDSGARSRHQSLYAALREVRGTNGEQHVQACPA